MRILYPVPCVGSPGDDFALALDTAAGHGARLRVVSAVDTEGIGRMEAGAPPGAIEIAVEAARAIEARESHRSADAVGALVREASERGIAATGEVAEGEPRVAIGRAAFDADLMVSGISARFAWGGHDKPAALALSLMKDRTVPVLLAGSPYRPVRTVAIGCGGGERTLRAAGAMARTGLWKNGVRMLLLAVDDDPGRAEEKLSGPREILRDAEYAGAEEIVAPMPKVENFLAACDREKVDAVVLGGWGEHRWDDLFGFSVTGRLLRDGRRHLFLFM